MGCMLPRQILNVLVYSTTTTLIIKIGVPYGEVESMKFQSPQSIFFAGPKSIVFADLCLISRIEMFGAMAMLMVASLAEAEWFRFDFKRPPYICCQQLTWTGPLVPSPTVTGAGAST